MPPKGIGGSSFTVASLMWQMPVSSCRAICIAAPTSALNTAADSPLLGVVGDPYRLVDVVDRHDRDHRSERFLRVDPHLGRDVHQHGRREEEAVRLSTSYALRALGDCFFDVLRDPLQRGLVHERTDLRVRLPWITHSQRTRATGQLL